jgi:hypothetical protein
MSIMVMVAWRCDLCGHIWLARGPDPPALCAKCHKRRWFTGEWDGNVELGDQEGLKIADVDGGVLKIVMVEGVGMVVVRVGPPAEGHEHANLSREKKAAKTAATNQAALAKEEKRKRDNHLMTTLREAIRRRGAYIYLRDEKREMRKDEAWALLKSLAKRTGRDDRAATDENGKFLPSPAWKRSGSRGSQRPVPESPGTDSLPKDAPQPEATPTPKPGKGGKPRKPATSRRAKPALSPEQEERNQGTPKKLVWSPRKQARMLRPQ